MNLANYLSKANMAYAFFFPLSGMFRFQHEEHLTFYNYVPLPHKVTGTRKIYQGNALWSRTKHTDKKRRNRTAALNDPNFDYLSWFLRLAFLSDKPLSASDLFVDRNSTVVVSFMFRARLQCSDEAVGCILKARGKKKTEKLDESGINNPVFDGSP